MPQPVYEQLDSGPADLGSNGDTYVITTIDATTRTVNSIDGQYVSDGTEIAVINNGPGDIVLKHNSGDAGNRMFLPDNTDRTLTATGRPYWFKRNTTGPLGDGWYNGEDPP